MIPEEATTPEERLLKLIRGERKPKNKIREERVLPRKLPSRIKIINMSLVVVLVIVATVLLADLVIFSLHRETYLQPAKEKAVSPVPAKEILSPAPEPPIAGSPDASNSLGSRELFRSRPVVPADKITQGAYDNLKDISLKGIIAGDRPQAIIEDEKNKKSFFIYKGETVGGIKVEDIQSDRVILKVNGEVLELTL